MPVEISRLCGREIDEEPSDPRRQMLFEDPPLILDGRGEVSADQARHDLAENRRVILGLMLVLDTLDAEHAEILAQARQRPLVEKTGEVVRAIGKQLAAADADEEIEEFTLDRLGARSARGFRERRVRKAERRVVAAQ